MTNWKTISIKESAEPLVPLGPFSQYPHLGGSAIYYGERVNSPYFPEGLRGSLITHFVRRGVAERLDKFARSLPQGIIPWIEDCYRNLETQAALYDWYENTLRTEHPDWDRDRITAEAQHFVSLPSADPSKPAPHNTGGSVDLMLAKLPLARWIERKVLLILIGKVKRHDPDEEKYWKVLYLLHMRMLDIHRRFTTLLPLGTLLDEVKKETVAYYYEENPPQTRKEKLSFKYRLLLRRAMERAGFTQYKWEWWHYNYGNQMWAEENGSSNAFFGAANFSEENRWWENMRRAHYHRQLIWHRGHDVTLRGSGKLGYDPFVEKALSFAKIWASHFGNPTFTTHPKAAIL